MNDITGKDEPIFSFGVPVDKTAYFIPTVGITMIAFVGASMLAMIGGMIIGGNPALRSLIGSDLLDILMMSFVVMVGLGAGVMWVRRLMRIHRERKLVIDRNGITYFAFADKAKVMRWSDIVRVTEIRTFVDDGDSPDCHALEYHLQSRKFVIRDSDFINYDDIKFITLNRLPEKTTTFTTAHPRMDFREVARAFRLWGFPERAANLRKSSSANRS